mgnify:CR=1 FL=1
MQEIMIYDGEDLELRRLAYRVDERRDRAERENAEKRAQRAETKLRAERAKAKKEKRGLASFTTIIALVVAMLICAAAGPWWMAIFPFLGAVLVTWKAGWR